MSGSALPLKFSCFGVVERVLARGIRTLRSPISALIKVFVSTQRDIAGFMA
jgi:hypothetical protein